MTATERQRLAEECETPPLEILRPSHTGHLTAEAEHRRVKHGSAAIGQAAAYALDKHYEGLAEAFNEGLARAEARNQRRLRLENQREKPRKKRT